MSDQAFNLVLSRLFSPSSLPAAPLFSCGPSLSAPAAPLAANTTPAAALSSPSPLAAVTTISQAPKIDSLPTVTSGPDWAVLLGLFLISVLLLLSVGSGLVLLSLPSVRSCFRCLFSAFSSVADGYRGWYSRYEQRILRDLAAKYGYRLVLVSSSPALPPRQARNDPADTAAMFAFETSPAMVDAYAHTLAPLPPAAAVTQRSNLSGTASPAVVPPLRLPGLFSVAPAPAAGSSSSSLFGNPLPAPKSGLFRSAVRPAPAAILAVFSGGERERREVEKIIEETEIDDEDKRLLGGECRW